MKSVITKSLGMIAAAMILTAPMVAHAGSSTVKSGSFIGENKHITTGGVQIVKTADGGAVVILDRNFTLDGAPDPRVGLGKNGKYDGKSDMGVLQNINGLQFYVVPGTVNVDDYNEVYIWCEKFNVSLGVASLI